MKAVDDIKAIINDMLSQEMEYYDEAVGCGEGNTSVSPVIHTMLKNLLVKIDRLPSVWHDISERPRDVPTVVCTNGRTVWMAMSYEYNIESTKWAYIEDLI